MTNKNKVYQYETRQHYELVTNIQQLLVLVTTSLPQKYYFSAMQLMAGTQP